MKGLRNFLDRLEPLFTQGGRFERYHAVFEMVDTLFYSPPDVARGSPHVRDALDLKRVMILVVFAVTPCALVGIMDDGPHRNSDNYIRGACNCHRHGAISTGNNGKGHAQWRDWRGDLGGDGRGAGVHTGGACS